MAQCAVKHPETYFFEQKSRNPQIHITANILQITTTLDQICAVLWAIFLNVTKQTYASVETAPNRRNFRHQRKPGRAVKLSLWLPLPSKQLVCATQANMLLDTCCSSKTSLKQATSLRITVVHKQAKVTIEFSKGLSLAMFFAFDEFVQFSWSDNATIILMTVNRTLTSSIQSERIPPKMCGQVLHIAFAMAFIRVENPAADYFWSLDINPQNMIH